MNEPHEAVLTVPHTAGAPWPVMICLLGNFRVMCTGQSLPIRAGGKSEGLLAHLGLQFGRRVSRERLVQALWPTNELALGLNSLNNLVYHLHKLLGPALQEAAPVLHEDGYYRLNHEAGIGVDVVCFDSLVETGDNQSRVGNTGAALVSYRHAAELYRDDLCVAPDAQSLVERERLRARYLTLLSQLADHHYLAGDYLTSLTYAWRLLARDPCREDAHRLLMQCYVRRGERSAALHQFQVCENLLHTELDVPPEPATVALLEQIRYHPDTV